MNHRTLLLATCTAAGLLSAFSGQAMPLATPHAATAAKTAVPVDYREHGGGGDDEHRRKGQDRHGGNHERDGYANRGGDDDDDDDDRGDFDGRGSAMQQNANPPGNGLFTSGATPRVQMN